MFATRRGIVCPSHFQPTWKQRIFVRSQDRERDSEEEWKLEPSSLMNTCIAFHCHWTRMFWNFRDSICKDASSLRRLFIWTPSISRVFTGSEIVAVRPTTSVSWHFDVELMEMFRAFDGWFYTVWRETQPNFSISKFGEHMFCTFWRFWPFLL